MKNNLLKKFVLASLILTSGIASANIIFNASGSDNCFPFACGPMNYQQVYSSSGFDNAVNISGISFKSAQDRSGSAFNNIGVNVTFDLSTTSVNPNNITGNFSSNRGGDDSIVFSGTAFISSSGGNIFDITFPFTSSFMYDPTMGNLLVGMNVTSSQSMVRQFEAGSSSLIGRNFSGNAGHNYGLATSFITATSVPEPTTTALMLGGFTLLAFATRKKQLKK